MTKIVLFPAKERRIKQMLEQEQKKTWDVVEELRYVQDIERKFHQKNRRDCFVFGFIVGMTVAYLVLQGWLFFHNGG